MENFKITSATPLPVLRTLRKMGQDIRDARLRRRIPVALMAERASISRTTLSKVEKGDPGVSFGIYATVLFVLGMTDRLADVASPMHDLLGRHLDEERLPKRIRLPKARRKQSSNSSGEGV
jgi:transcriptional regulator with XRE-family HTH domain